MTGGTRDAAGSGSRRRTPRSAASAGALVLALLPALLGAGPAAVGDAAPAAPADTAALADSIAAVIEEESLLGAAVAVLLPDGRLWTRGFGVADRATGRPVTDTTLFRIGSISKMFVGVAALQQRERGSLELDDPLRELAPDLAFENPWAAGHPVRLVHLLEHTAGFDDLHPAQIFAGREAATLRQNLARHPHARTVRWRPGRFSSYSSPGTGSAALAVGRAAGRPFEALVEEEIFRPLGMRTATYRREEAVERGLAAGYARSESREAVEYWTPPNRPAGAVNASVRDMARFVRALIRRGTLDGRRVLEPASVRRMETPATGLAALRAGVPAGYGLQSFANERGGFLWHGHTGGMEGYYAVARYLDEHDRGFVALFNTSDPAAGRVERLIEDFLTRDLSPAQAAPASVDPTRLADLEGWYVPATPRYELLRFLETLTGVLRVEATGQALEVGPAPGGGGDRWRPAGDGRFYADGDPVGVQAFVEADGERFLAMEGGEDGNYRRTAAWVVWGRWIGTAAALLLAASGLLFALSWGSRAALGRLELPDGEPLVLRGVPLAASAGFFLFLFGWAGILGGDLVEALIRISATNVHTLAVTAGSLLVAVGAPAGLVLSVRHRRLRRADAASTRRVWWHATLVSVGCLLAAAWLAAHGLVGVRPWAY